MKITITNELPTRPSAIKKAPGANLTAIMYQSGLASGGQKDLDSQQQKNIKAFLAEKRNKKAISRRLKLYFLVNIFIFNVFFIGFVLNFITYSNTNWIRNENYVFGLFQYCHFNSTTFQKIPNSYVFYRDGFKLSYKAVSDVKCFIWNRFNKPKFISRSLYIQSTALVMHLSALVVSIVFIIVYNKLKLIELKKLKNANAKNPVVKKIRFFNDVEASQKLTLEFYLDNIKLFSNHVGCNLAASFVGYLIGVLYGANLIIFCINQAFSRLAGKHEQFAWCFWASLVGFFLTFLSTSILFVHTIYFRFIYPSRKEDVTMHTVQSSPMDVYATNSILCMESPVKQSMTNKVADTSTSSSSSLTTLSNMETSMRSARFLNESLPTYQDLCNKKGRDKAGSFFRRLYLSVTHTSHDKSPDNILRLDSDLNANINKLIKMESGQGKNKFILPKPIRKYSLKMKNAQLPSQVYPAVRKQKSRHTKMFALPYGSLSGTAINSAATKIQKQSRRF